jgi:hypothetical protein
VTPELVEKGTLTEKERSVVLQCCEEDKCFIQEGPLAGFIDYEAGFFQRYISTLRPSYTSSLRPYTLVA